MDKSNPQSDAGQSPSSFTVQSPKIELPKGGGAIRGIGEKFAANPVTGTGSTTVPIATSPGRSGFGPQLSLAYDSGAGNGPFGLGWNLSLPSITRKTDKGLPQYMDEIDSDEFILSGAEDLVPCLKQDASGNWLPDTVPLRTVDGTAYDIRRYRPRIEGLFARIERWTSQTNRADSCWRSISKDNITTWYGRTEKSRIADPDDPGRIFSWLICESYDDKGNVIAYHYDKEDSTNIDSTQVHERNRNDTSRSANSYIKRITYANRTPYFPELAKDKPRPKLPDNSEWLFETVFDYDQGHYQALDLDPDLTADNQHQRVQVSQQPVADSWAVRPDPFSTYRAGFEVRSYRRCRRVLMFHHFTELGIEPCLVRSTQFDYNDLENPNDASLEAELDHEGSTRFSSKISAVIQSAYVHHTHKPIKQEDIEVGAGVNYLTYIEKSLPPLEFHYTRAVIQQQQNSVEPENLENLPQGLDGHQYQWADIDGEGAGGILSEQNGDWFYKRNLSPLPIKDEQGVLITSARFAPLEKISPLPSFASLSSGQQQLLDLAGDGQIDVVTYKEPTPGFFERTQDGDWQSFKAFISLPNIEWQDANLRFVDLTGDGHADIFITEDEAFTWYASLAETGFAPSKKVQQLLDEEQGPRLVFNDGTQSIYLSDFSGDGLSDLVRIRNGEVCYWPNLGYCRFGAKVSMDHAPRFDAPDQFDQKRIRLADIDGTGVTDILYLKHDGVRIYFNHSGNSWSTAYHLTQLPAIDNTSNVMTVDLLGNGTACLVWSSPLPANTQAPMRYVDLMGGQKPHLLTKVVNNLGAETHIHYTPSTQFYLRDKQQGKEWITRLHFPVHVVERTETYDHISHSRFVSHFAYHHGYFDGHEREFRGFGMVEQWDTEEYASLSQSHVFPAGDNIQMESHVPPVHTKTWYHTGAYLGRHHISDYFAGLLNQNDKGEYFREPGLDDEQARAMLLPDTILPDDLSIDEEREACRALKGQMLRQEVYADDSSEQQSIPYTVTEQNFNIRRLQTKADNPHAVFLTYARESINYHYERNSADPRTQHALTLEVDDYGNVLTSAAVAYGRRMNSPDAQLQPQDREKQRLIHITCSLNSFTNAITDKVDHYRTPLPAEAKSYEIRKPEQEKSGDGLTDRYNFDALLVHIQQAGDGHHDINYEDIDFEQAQTAVSIDASESNNYFRRLIEHLRSYYRPNDFGVSHDDPLLLLPLGQLETKALPGESYKLAYTPGLASAIYVDSGKLTQVELDAILTDEGKYVHSEGDNNWWIPSGRLFYSMGTNDSAATELAEAQSHFYLAKRYRNPFHTKLINTEAKVVYDNYDLMVKETADAVGNKVTVGERQYTLTDGTELPEKPGHNYRVLQAETMMGPNRNRTRVAFDVLGLVAGSAIMGKPEDNPQQGDVIDNTFITNLTRHQINTFEDDPLGQSAYDLLSTATSRIIYDVHRFYHSQQQYPNEPSQWQASFASTIVRETHHNDLNLANNEKSKFQVGFSYSDGFGREIQKKIQVEPGPVNGLGDNVNPRWVGSGWTIFNNKGKPVRQYEPYFSTLPDHRHRFEFARIAGVSPILFYDQLQRVVATIHPNNSYEKVLLNPWQQESWDVNDTVKLDPRTDADVSAYTDAYFTSQPANWKTWLQQREVDPNNPPADTYGQNPEQDAAVRTLEHAGTSTLAYFDALGRPFLSVANNGKDNTGNNILFETRTLLDIEGNERDVIDAKGRTVMRYDYYMAGPEKNEDGSTPNRIHQSSMEAGERWLLNDIAGDPIRSWDSRGHYFRTEYDKLRRPLKQFVRGFDASHSDPRTVVANDILIESIEYGEGQAGDLNLSTRVFKQSDGSGLVINVGHNPDTGKDEAYDFKGNLLRGRRQFCLNHEEIPDWNQSSTPAQEIFTSSTRVDALNRPIQQIAPYDETANPLKLDITQLIYNEANMLETVNVWLAKESEPNQLLDIVTANHTIVKNIDYDAKGQRKLIEYGNGTETRYDYDEKTFRLTKLYTRRGAVYDEDCGIEPNRFLPPDVPPPDIPCGIQNLHYTYDPAGNITHIHDLAQPTIYFDNQCIEASNDYLYDAIYRLTSASGREHKGGNQQPGPNNRSREHHPIPGPCNDDIQRYVEVYRYDEVGNIMEMLHHAGGTLSSPGGVAWRRRYQYTTFNNQLRSTSRLGEDPKPEYSDNPAEYYQDKYEHDSHGNITTMSHLSGMTWDFKDQLLNTSRQLVNNGNTPQTTWYVYDSGGQRVRKVTVLENGNKKDERLYLGGFEIYRKYNGTGQTVNIQRESLHIMDDKQRVALIENKTLDNTGVVDDHNNDEVNQPVIRYQINNHLGSACTELDDQAKVISYEEYHPYGSSAYHAKNKGVKAAAKRYRYSGKERDEENGFYYYGARYYAGWLGSWISCDVIKNSNRYKFGANNPVRYIDPNGRDVLDTVKNVGLFYYETARDFYTLPSKLAINLVKSRIEDLSQTVQSLQKGDVMEAVGHFSGVNRLMKPLAEKTVHYQQGGASALETTGLIVGDVSGMNRFMEGVTGETIDAEALSTAERVERTITGGAQVIGTAGAIAAPISALSAEAKMAQAVSMEAKTSAAMAGAVEIESAASMAGKSKNYTPNPRIRPHGKQPSPRPQGTQSHHPEQQTSLTRNIKNYSANEDPALLMQTPEHRATFQGQAAQRARGAAFEGELGTPAALEEAAAIMEHAGETAATAGQTVMEHSGYLFSTTPLDEVLMYLPPGG